jgi:glycosyltransferase involved in cell wall biosynthesis
MKILLLSPNQIHRYNWGHQLFRNEIGKHHDVFYYGEGYPNFNKKLTAPQIVKKYGPFDLLLTYGLRYSIPFQNIGNVKIKKAHIIIDLFPPHPGGYKGVILKYKKFVTENKYDFFLYRQKCQAGYLKEIGCDVPSFWLPFSVDINAYKKKNFPKIYDVLTSSNQRKDVYPNRAKVNKLVKRMKLKCVVKKIVHQAYINAINQSKICIISTNVFNSPNMKFTEFSSCGTFILSDKPADFDELGLKNKKHLILYNDLKDLEDKIKYFLKHDKEREAIAKNGMKFVRKNHNNSIRVQQFIKIAKEMI